MTAPDRIQITHQPRTMTTPTPRAALKRLIELEDAASANGADPDMTAWDDAVAAGRAALKAEPEGESPRPDGDWFTVALVAQDMRSRGLAEQVAGAELLKLANSNRSQPGRPAIQPAPKADPGHIDQLAAIIRKVDGNNSMGAAALAEAILEQYPLAFLVDPPAAAPEPGENLATPPAPGPEEVGELVEMLTQEAAILEAYCNKIANGECRTLACLQRGGYIRGTESPDSSVATCPELEKTVAKRRAATLLQQQCAPPAPEPEGGRWTEGVCGDGAAILFDGAMVPVEEVVRSLNTRSATPPAPQAGEAEA
jgi:hypothetical protein